MDVKSVRNYIKPAYPDRPGVDEEPEILLALPERWKMNPAVITALASTAVLAATWQASAGQKAGPPDSTRVAPVFQHGDGRGSFGCEMVAPAVYLSEDEARQVIYEEARRAGVNFADKQKTIAKASIPDTGSYSWNPKTPYDKRTAPDKYSAAPLDLVLDGTDEKRNISFEFVSDADVNKWRKSPEMSSVSAHYAYPTALILASSIKMAAPKGTYAVFYEPYVYGDYKNPPKDAKGHVDYPAWESKLRVTAKDDLRKQVQDFIKWLKAEGVI